MRKRYSCSKQLVGAFEVDAALDNAVGGHFEVGDEIFMQCAIIWWFTESNAAPDNVMSSSRSKQQFFGGNFVTRHQCLTRPKPFL